jgi:hypothetical protein
MTISTITRKRAVEITKARLPYFHNWYLVSDLQWYPDFGDWKLCVAGDYGLNAIIGKRKQVAIKAVAA